MCKASDLFLLEVEGNPKMWTSTERGLQDRPEQAKVPVGTNSHPLGKTEATGPSCRWQCKKVLEERCSTLA